MGVKECDEWLSDGLTENIISVLSQSPDTFVIGRTSSFSYKGKEVTAADAARDLGVRYVLSGAVQANSEQLRVTAEFSDAIEGRLLWTLRENGVRDDFFEMQDAITDRIFEEIAVSLTPGEDVRRMLRRPGSIELMRYSLQARALFQSFNPDDHRKGAALAKRLIEQTPDHEQGYTFNALFEWARPLVGRSKDRQAELKLASEFAEKSLSISEGSEVLTTIATINLARGDCENAIKAADRALEIAPSGNDALGVGGRVKSRCGQWKEGLVHMLEAMRVEPKFPGYLPTSASLSHLALGQYEKAKELAQVALSEASGNPIFTAGAQIYIIAAEALSGNDVEAKRLAAALPSGNPLTTLRFMGFQLSNVRDRDFIDKLLTAIRAAGVPET